MTHIYNFPENSKFLVTGGAGFIGSHLVDKLLALNMRVVVLDNYSSGKVRNLEHHQGHKNLIVITGDIRDRSTCQSACIGVDYVLHQAAIGSVPRSIDDPMTSHDVNVTGFINMLKAATNNNVKRFVYASSSAVYGDEETLPKKEGVEGELLSPYAVTKFINELYANNFRRVYGLQTIGLRYFNVFGPRQDPDSVYAAVVPLFVKKLLENTAPTINGDGQQSRDFTYIDNVVDANLKACLAEENACGDAYNIAYGGREFLNDLYKKLCELLGKNIQPVYGADRVGDIKHSNADISKAIKKIKYDPKIDLNKGLELSIQWYKDNV
ncbi:MAG: LPS biosynthesis protein WbpP [Alphaproteobacteria bacterium CG_4_10_14_0_8_um_filter_37_21]|nr:MAG: LPS biosynthesis protein WbpP [Alphaproteobacteria bacterium CG_4_10_14_0_8_um_filter_37_21]